MLKVPDPELQIDFAGALADIRTRYLQDALLSTVRQLDITELDKALAEYVPKASLSILASCGLRAELLFAVPVILDANPRLLAYYRLLYGYSQKEFYSRETGISQFSSMEKHGRLPRKGAAGLAELCRSLAGAGALLLDGIGGSRMSRELLDDLTLLTLGPQLRGGANVRKGADGIVKVFDVIEEIARDAVTGVGPSRIEITNAAGRRVLIEFAPDPDIIIREEMSGGSFRDLIAIEVKGGSDFSNIHNRIGEAEKSHQKARAVGYVECWTVVNVGRMDLDMARRESPTTNRFYRMSELFRKDGSEYEDFKDRVISLTGIRS
ncbi:MAG: XcyI family restriction endonuclease [Bauldia sp.]|uniref:XcyI family restriction endonuclease n=1 Tax=Bauldia sp. TaxID=2575872 RepID=UPI001DC9BF40|nr:XcyI family restriction endonuclease [Bauldia sp.]MCB1494559.1 XcyI family restriction endonuclease [Bauldia sp.]